MSAVSGGERLGMWTAFGLVHAWLAYLGVVVVPSEAFYDVDLYRYWMYLGLHEGVWPVLDQPWVYPAGALLPMLVPALVSTLSTPLYALGWCAMVTALDAVAVAALLGRGRTGGAWWWLTFLVLLGPVAMGRLDAVAAPLMVTSLVVALRSERGMRLAATLLTFGAWVKVAPGALLLPLVAASRRPLRDVVLMAALVCVAVVAAVAGGGGLGRVLGFLTTQRGRGLQVESVTATPWVLASLVRDDVTIRLNDALITYEVAGPGTATAAAVLDVVLVALVAAVAAVLLVARRRGRASEALVPGALTVLLVLVVANKVGSPQFLTWVAAPMAVLLTGHHLRVSRPTGRMPWVTVAGLLALVSAGLTQIVFPWGYMALLTSGPDSPGMVLVLAARNVCLVALLACAAYGLLQAVRSDGIPGGADARDAAGQAIEGATS